MDTESNAVEDQQFTPSSYEENLIHYHYEFIKSLLYRIRSEILQYPDCHVIRITGLSDGFHHKPKLISVTIEKSTGFIRIIDNYITATVLFEKQLYDLSMFVSFRTQRIDFTIVVLAQVRHLKTIFNQFVIVIGECRTHEGIWIEKSM
ncbi:MAG: hypothetical protein WAV76_02815 [Bacteroidota bacterium]